MAAAGITGPVLVTNRCALAGRLDSAVTSGLRLVA